MARSRGFVARGARRSPGRLTEWFAPDAQTSAFTLAAGASVLSFSLSATGLAKRPFTITRTYVEFWVRSDQDAVDEFAPGAFGFSVVSTEATAIGVTAVPQPGSNAFSDKFFVHQFWMGNNDRGYSAATLPAATWHRYTVDSKAQRKLQDGEDLAIVVQNTSAAAAVFFLLQFRMLVKLS